MSRLQEIEKMFADMGLGTEAQRKKFSALDELLKLVQPEDNHPQPIFLVPLPNTAIEHLEGKEAIKQLPEQPAISL